MALTHGIQDYLTKDEILSLELWLKKKENLDDKTRDEILKLLCTQEKIWDLFADVSWIKALLAQKWLKECTPEERKKLYEDLDIPHFYMGEIELALGYNQEAIKYLTLAAESQEDSVLAARASIDLWNLYYQANDLVKTEQYYKKAIEKNDKKRSAHAHISLWNFYCIYKTTEAYSRAETCYKNAMKFEDPETTARANLLSWHLYMAINQPGRAKMVYEIAAKSEFADIAKAANVALEKITPAGPSA